MLAVMVLAVLALLAAIALTAQFTVAGGERAGARHAADAAALAGAQAVLDELPDQLSPGFLTAEDIPTLLGGGVCLQTGRIDADRLAAANGATLTSYCYDVFRDEISTGVRMNSTQGTSPSTADATAATTFDASRCALDDGFAPPTPTPAPPPTDDDGDDGDDGDGEDGDEGDEDAPPPPPPPTRVGTSIDCGTGPLALAFQVASARFGFVDLATELADVRPRLTR